MNISVTFQYPEKESIATSIPNHFALHEHWKSIRFIFNEELDNRKRIYHREAILLSIGIKE